MRRGVIGTGVYIDDMRAHIWSAAERGLAFAFILLLSPGRSPCSVLTSARSLSHENMDLKREMDRFLAMVRTERADRHQHDDPNYAGPERRADASRPSAATPQPPPGRAGTATA